MKQLEHCKSSHNDDTLSEGTKQLVVLILVQTKQNVDLPAVSLVRFVIVHTTR